MHRTLIIIEIFNAPVMYVATQVRPQACQIGEVCNPPKFEMDVYGVSLIVRPGYLARSTAGGIKGKE